MFTLAQMGWLQLLSACRGVGRWQPFLIAKCLLRASQSPEPRAGFLPLVAMALACQRIQTISRPQLFRTFGYIWTLGVIWVRLCDGHLHNFLVPP